MENDVQVAPVMVESAKPRFTTGQKVAIYAGLGLVTFGLGALALFVGQKIYNAVKARKAVEAETVSE